MIVIGRSPSDRLTALMNVSSLGFEEAYAALAIVAAEEMSVESNLVGAPLWEAPMVPPRGLPIAPLKEVKEQPE